MGITRVARFYGLSSYEFDIFPRVQLRATSVAHTPLIPPKREGAVARPSKGGFRASRFKGSEQMNWTTREPPELTRPYGVEELHTVVFAPRGWLGKGTTVSLGIPECELNICVIGADGEPVIFNNRPKRNKSVRKWLRFACEQATSHKACLLLNCDTVDQARETAAIAARRLPNHERIALERMYEPANRSRSGLS
jgi:hypothetical protein